MSQGTVNLGFPASGSSKASLIFGGDTTAADEGSFFVSTLAATASTAAACTTQALADTNPGLALFNAAGSPNGFNVYLRYIKAVMTVVAGSNTSLN